MDGGHIIGEFLQKHGIKYLFTLCGGHISPILVGAKDSGLTVIDTRHEANAVFAADAMSRLTGTPGVVAVTAGPGITNSVTALKNAQMAQSPLILLGGSVATVLKGRGALQDIEQLELLESVTKWNASIEEDCDIIPLLEEAFDVAMGGVPGPVFLECPIDLLYPEGYVRTFYGESMNKAKSLKEKVINWYLRRHVDKLFSCTPKGVEIAKKEDILPFSTDLEDIQKVASQINNSQKPVLILGSQATLRTELVSELSEKLQNFGIPIFLTGMARGLMGEEHPFYFRHKRSSALREADLVIIAGMPCDFRLGYGRVIHKEAYHIALNRSTEDLELNKKPDLGIQTDPGTFLLELLGDYSFDHSKWGDWHQVLREREEKGHAKITRFAAKPTDYINPLVLCQEINKVMAENSIIVGDGGDFVATASYTVKPRKPLTWLDPGPFGTLGVGAGFAMASKLANPQAEVWLLYGDGAAGYSILELDTMVRHHLPIIAVIGNDAGWTQITRDQVQYLNDEVGTTLTYNDYHLTAQSLGAKGILVDKEQNLEEKLQLAKNYAKRGFPVLINARIGKTNFRKGSISM